MKATLRSYVTGFVLSIILTLVAYVLVQDHVNSGHKNYSHDFIIAVLIGLALVQFIVQAIYFLHLKNKGDARWNLLAFLFMSGVVIVVVIGSLWIIANLDYHHDQTKTPEETSNYIIEDELPNQQEATDQTKSEYPPH